MSKRRFILTCTISIFLVAILMIGSTYSVFTSQDVEEDLNVYKTGNLVVNMTSNSAKIDNPVPVSGDDILSVIPVRITVENTGNVPYMFDVILSDTTAGNVIDYQYLYTKVGKLENKLLDGCKGASATVNGVTYRGRIIKEDVIIPANKTVNIDVRIWVGEHVKNTEIGKSFYGKFIIDGQAIYDYNEDIDNSVLESPANLLLSAVAPGSYVAYTGNNGCTGEACNGQNANYVDDTNMGYCSGSSNKFTVNGWRVGYTSDSSAYLVSAGAPECVKIYSQSKSSSTSSRYFTSSTAFLTSSTATLDSSTSTFTLSGTPTNYTFPTDVSSLNDKFTCANGTDGTCTTLYSIDTNSSAQTLTLNKYSTDSCSNSTISSSSNFKNCSIAIYRSYRNSSGGTSYSGQYYYGTEYILTNGGFQLSGTMTLGRPSIGKYTCKSGSSTTVCSKLYYIQSATSYQSSLKSSSNTGCTGSTTTNSGQLCYYFGSYNTYNFADVYATYGNQGTSYLYGNAYEFDVKTGKFILKNTSSLSWGSNSSTIIGDKKYTCFSTSDSCGRMYEITGDSSSNLAVYYTYTSNSVDSTVPYGSDDRIFGLNKLSQDYCNAEYAYGGVCNENSAWNMNGTDFEKITGSPLYYNSSSDKSCYSEGQSTACGYGNDLIDNGSYYWYGLKYDSNYSMNWNAINRYINSSAGTTYGLRPVIRLAPSVIVTGGSGTYEDPYTIGLENQIRKNLNEVEPGSYVAYTGNNGCTGKACEGQNANYVNDTDMGYCSGSSNKFTVNGWRVGYIKDGTTYLLSAGSPECLCTNSDGTASNSSCSNYEQTAGAPKHLANLNNRALKYCNVEYAYGGVCNSASSWNMNAIDFQNITGSPLSDSSCYHEYSSTSCGYGNDLIDNGSYYWFATPYDIANYRAFAWGAGYRLVDYYNSNFVRGVRPVIRLAASVVVTGGSGTYEDPYTIGK